MTEKLSDIAVDFVNKKRANKFEYLGMFMLWGMEIYAPKKMVYIADPVDEIKLPVVFNRFALRIMRNKATIKKNIFTKITNHL